MIIGVDFDNTIVCYDGIFHRVAMERGLIHEDLPQDKKSVRDYLREIGREADWTEMQGYVYGPRLIDAKPYPGVLEFFRSAVQAGIELRIISHKTKHPFLGEPYNLHTAAWGWLEANGFFDPERIGIRRDQVFFELTKEDKHQRIGTAGCTHFIDDLPEFLLDSGFPHHVDRILFNPNETARDAPPLLCFQNWQQISSSLLKQPVVMDFAKRTLGLNSAHLAPVTGGANNRVFRVINADTDVIIKAYHHSDSDQRDRFTAEQRFYNLQLPSTPKPLAWDNENRLAAFECICGRKLSTDEVSEADVRQCIEWICGLQEARLQPSSGDVALAADACLSIEDHVRLVERRLNRLIDAESDHEEFRSFVTHALAPHIKDLAAGVREEAGAIIDLPLTLKFQVLSPSDFGFHNAMKDESGQLWFFDFEYAGWDDPVKLLCDFFCQPQVPVSPSHASLFVDRMRQITGDESLPDRFKMLLPLHAAKWACILLNEFVAADAQRREFAGLPDRRDDQMAKAHRMLALSLSFSQAS